jgi:hypothetical protein
LKVSAHDGEPKEILVELSRGVNVYRTTKRLTVIDDIIGVAQIGWNSRSINDVDQLMVGSREHATARFSAEMERAH